MGRVFFFNWTHF